MNTSNLAIVYGVVALLSASLTAFYLLWDKNRNRLFHGFSLLKQISFLAGLEAYFRLLAGSAFYQNTRMWAE